MASKLTDNGLWESSRMMLPEHKEVINKFNHELQRRTRNELDEQEKEQVNRALQQSKKYRIPISIKLFDPFETLQIVGIVENISSLYGRFKVGDDWFAIDDIESVAQDIEPG